MDDLPTTIEAALNASHELWPEAFGNTPRRRPMHERLQLLRRLKAIRERFNLPTVWRTYGASGGVIASRALIDDEIARIEEAQRLLSAAIA